MSQVIVARVKPGSSKGPLVEAGPGDALTVYVRERAVDGKANAAAIRALATYLGVSRTHIALISGATSRHKRFRVD